jgi:hypothetical protein
VVAKHEVVVGLGPELRVAPPRRRREPVIDKRPVPTPGRYLRTAVDTVLAELAAGAAPDVQTLHRFDDTLRSALAWTAAVGDTCRVAAAVHAVRDARERLDAKDPDQAKLALLTAQSGLTLPMPAPRVPGAGH